MDIETDNKTYAGGESGVPPICSLYNVFMKDISEFTNRVINGDSQEVMKEMPEDSVNLVITSPPYFGCRVYGNETVGREEDPKDYIEKIVDFTRDIKRVLSPQGSFYLNIGDMYFGTKNGFGFKGFKGKQARKTHKHYIGRQVVDADGKYLQNKQLLLMPPRIAAKMQDEGWILRNTLIWKKNNAMPVPAPDRFLPTYEYIFLFSKSENYYFDLEESKKPPLYGKDVITVNIEPFGKHQATFPEKLVYPMIKTSSAENDIVMDPFGGSGTIARLAKRLGRQFINIEINEDFCKIAEKSIAETCALAKINKEEKTEEKIESNNLFDSL